MKKLLSVVFLLSLVVSFISVAPSISAIQIPEGAVIKTDHNPDVYIVKYKNGKQFKRLVLNPQVFESYGHLRWEDILKVDQSIMNSFTNSDLVRVDGRTDIYQLIPNGDVGTKHLLVSTKGYDLSSVYTINNVDFENYITGDVKNIVNLIDSDDNDNDGLKNWEEEQKGTNKNNPDTDGDGIVDGKDTHPAGGGRDIPQTFAWSYGDYDWTLTESIQEDWFDYYRAKPRGPHPSVEYVTSSDPFVKKISEALTKKANSGVSKTWVAVAFVQSLPYVDDVYTGCNEYPKYPVETFFEKNGDCEDTSYLAASIINAMNIGSVLILLPGHMAVGVYMNCDAPGTYYELDGRCYYYVETTNNTYSAGDIPEEYRNAKATLIKIPSGEIVDVYPQYNKPCNLSSDFSGYYYNGSNYYSDSQCNNLVYCLPYKEYYVNPQITTKFYWDSSCSQEVTIGCYKSTDYPGYFEDSFGFYYDSRCIQKAKICRPSSVYSDRYWDGDYSYWDSNCIQKVVSWCPKSIYYPGYFFNSIDYEIYIDYQCTRKANL